MTHNFRIKQVGNNDVLEAWRLASCAGFGAAIAFAQRPSHVRLAREDPYIADQDIVIDAGLALRGGNRHPARFG